MKITFYLLFQIPRVWVYTHRFALFLQIRNINNCSDYSRRSVIWDELVEVYMPSFTDQYWQDISIACKQQANFLNWMENTFV